MCVSGSARCTAAVALLLACVPKAVAQSGNRFPRAAGSQSAAERRPSTPDIHGPFSGVFFNPRVEPHVPGFQEWLCRYPQYRTQIRTHLHELVDTAAVNFIEIFVSIPYSLKTPSQAPREGQALEDWANVAYLDGAAAFVDDCHQAGVSVEIDLACNMWIPYSVDPRRQIANTGCWPMPDETPWDESAAWYRGMITYIEARALHPEAIAMWCMMGNHELGTAETCLWDRDDNPEIQRSTETFVKRVWPVFQSAGKRPKAPPIMLPIFADDSYWRTKSPAVRLSAFSNLKKWLIDDLALPPDYWVMTTYPFCDPAPDGFSYLKAIVGILGPENASRIISTDLKGPGHDDVRGCIMSIDGRPGPEILNWHFRKCTEYRFAGWWIFSYQDTPNDRSGIRDVAGRWKEDLVEVIKTSTR
jgi:hypothetical protein